MWETHHPWLWNQPWTGTLSGAVVRRETNSENLPTSTWFCIFTYPGEMVPSSFLLRAKSRWSMTTCRRKTNQTIESFIRPCFFPTHVGASQIILVLFAPTKHQSHSLRPSSFKLHTPRSISREPLPQSISVQKHFMQWMAVEAVPTLVPITPDKFHPRLGSPSLSPSTGVFIKLHVLWSVNSFLKEAFVGWLLACSCWESWCCHITLCWLLLRKFGYHFG